MIARGAAARLDRSDPDDVTAAETLQYLRDHKQAPDTAEYLIVRGTMAYVRWPNGTVRWQTVQSLREHGFTVPPRGLLQTRPA